MVVEAVALAGVGVFLMLLNLAVWADFLAGRGFHPAAVLLTGAFNTAGLTLFRARRRARRVRAGRAG